MMGPPQQRTPKLFYTGISLEERIPPDHPLRRIANTVDFSWLRPAVADLYGTRGNPSLDPVLILKLLFLLFYENVSSERALLRQLPCRLDWLWFLELDLDCPLPDHSVLSKARRRWGPQVFAQFFQRIVQQCVQAGLVEGSRVHVDASLIAADADTDKLKLALHLQGEAFYGQLEAAERTEVPPPQSPPPSSPSPSAVPVTAPVATVTSAASSSAAPSSPAPSAPTPSATCPTLAVGVPAPGTWVCPTDPDARLTRKNGHSILGYKDHRVVDDHCGIITATLTTAAIIDEGAMLLAALDSHAFNTGRIAFEPTADKGYGTAENYSRLQQRGTTPCIPHKAVREDPALFARSLFIYDPATDTYRCPAGETLTRYGICDNRRRYRTRHGVCSACPLQTQCTASSQGRVLSRQVRQDAIDWADTCLRPAQRKTRMRRRKIRAEGSFADAANRHGYKRARWRRLQRVTMQNQLIATVQNLRKLLRYGQPRWDRGIGSLPPLAQMAALGIVLDSQLPHRARPSLCSRAHREKIDRYPRRHRNRITHRSTTAR